jgi:serine/threonine protein kinase
MHSGADHATRVVPAGAHATPLPPAFAFLRPAQAPGELGRLGGYRVVRVLGTGGMGVVFLAEDMALKREVALKVMRIPPGEDLLSWRERFLREARALAAIKHPNLVSVYQAGEDRGTVFLAMELLRGETLEARIKRADPLSVPEIVGIAEQLAHGIAAVHGHGLIHRDIKPANIWLSVESSEDTEPLDAVEPPAAVQVKILDFGLVREVKGDTHLTEAGAVMGTPAYMSPEQVRGHALDHRTDLFSFGCVLYALCTGRPPFAADSPMAQAAALAADTPARVRALNPVVPRALSRLIADLLEKNPADRPESAGEVAQRLRAAAEPERAPAPRPFPRRHALKLVALIWVVLLALLAVVLTREPTRAPGVPEVKKDEPAGAKGADTKASSLKVPNAPLPPADEGAVEYLTRMYPIKTQKFPPPDRPQPPGVDGTVCVGGVRAAHGIFLHAAPPKTEPPYMTFVPGGAYRWFRAQVAINDSARNAVPPGSPVVFVVVGDGRDLWTSREHVFGDPLETCDIDVRDVQQLSISVMLRGPRHQGAHAVWIDPRFVK